ncbi:response regulator transcription factor [Lacrimispora aerotolerans]|uniref:response regulator transcription factor n=1 Tax=Lacrimispora aerotolerans TaxID=36832 RepID=UPI00047AFA2F|nr:response regulator transcription factor [Lacrimispora aerotolerans]
MSWNCNTEIDHALEKLSQDFLHLNWDFSPDPSSGNNELISHWLGEEYEEVMVSAFEGKKFQERFHRQDFFFIHFAYLGDYDALSASCNNRITIKEGDCYIGQPYSGYAVQRDCNHECIILAVLIRKETFFREYLSALSADSFMLNFFLKPQKDKYSEEFIHLEIPASSPIWQLLNVMILEYAHKTEDTQKILKPMVMSLAMYLSYEYKRQHTPACTTLIDRIMEYIESHSDSVTLKEIASHFGYHPVYISRLLPEKTGKTFSALVTESLMRRAKLLLDHTDLSIEKIADMLGYSNSSNFYKAFKQYYGTSPRQL